MEIKFLDIHNISHIADVPRPAKEFIPNWYRETESYIQGVKKPDGGGNTSGTIKRCMPVFDVITAGYIIPLPADVWVSLKDGNQYFEWPSLNLIEFHPVVQASLHPLKNDFPYPKWINPWGLITPKGYSTLFIQPVHRELPFTILPGLVDTDTYNSNVNFPFVINDPTFEGAIPKGTPIVQLIPIKRESWTSTLSTHSEEVLKASTSGRKLRLKIFDSYKTQFWNKKEYK